MSTIVMGAQSSTLADWPVPEERRTVSVLFADIVGSTALVDRLDPEEVRALQRAYFDTVAGVLARWGGVVEKYVGDAVMALFGARESDGHDAYRAVRAGLEIQRALDGRALPGAAILRTRVGVATGEALVDVAALRDGAYGVASGSVITAAARLQEHAPPGGVVVCAATRRATAGVIVHQALAPLTVAGKPRPVDVALAAGVARPEPARHDGRLVGRRRQLATARDRVIQAVRDRAPRWVSLVGPGGSGRSRLLHELRRTVVAVDGVPVRWYVVACPPHPEQPLEPAADLLRAFAGLRADDPPAAVHRRLLAALDGLVPSDRVLPTAVALEGLLDGSVPAGAAVWQRVLLRLADRQPLVVAVDDADRAAPATTRFLRTLFAAAVARRVPLAVVTTGRPQWTADRPGPDSAHDEVPLLPLSTVETGRLLRHLLARAGQSATLAARLLPLVGGLPGHAEAYVRQLIDGADPTQPPERVRASASARLDACDGRERAALMVAVALGPGAAAAAVDLALGWPAGHAERTLCRLTARGLLRRTARGGYDVADPALRRVAQDRLPRTVRAIVTRRAEATAPARQVPLPRIRPTPLARPVHPARIRPVLPASARPAHPGWHLGRVRPGPAPAALPARRPGASVLAPVTGSIGAAVGRPSTTSRPPGSPGARRQDGFPGAARRGGLPGVAPRGGPLRGERAQGSPATRAAPPPPDSAVPIWVARRRAGQRLHGGSRARSRGQDRHQYADMVASGKPEGAGSRSAGERGGPGHGFSGSRLRSRSSASSLASIRSSDSRDCDDPQ
uniref:AAA family ATPase n=1 Tax=Micromonospora carbonacea TaxID=47853 RepID=A0A7D6GRX2_9ACTN|nr:AAA family ATPase [Micromonospora carbonacea]